MTRRHRWEWRMRWFLRRRNRQWCGRCGAQLVRLKGLPKYLYGEAGVKPTPHDRVPACSGQR